MKNEIFLIIVGMTLVTYFPRMLPLVVLSKHNIPKLLYRWLSFVPVAVLAALLGPSLAMPDGTLQLTYLNKFLLAAIPTLAVAIKTRSLVTTVIIGMVASGLLELVVK